MRTKPRLFFRHDDFFAIDFENKKALYVWGIFNFKKIFFRAKFFKILFLKFFWKNNFEF